MALKCSLCPQQPVVLARGVKHPEVVITACPRCDCPDKPTKGKNIIELSQLNHGS